VLTRPLVPIEKSMFVCLSNLKEKQLKKLVQGFFGKIIITYHRPLKGKGQLDLKSMYECIKQLKRKVAIIMKL
jgi:hypothetical protein